jgi:hypothetical protein
MQASDFDFDVITGPSTPREDPDEVRPQEQTQPQPPETMPATPPTR